MPGDETHERPRGEGVRAKTRLPAREAVFENGRERRATTICE